MKKSTNHWTKIYKLLSYTILYKIWNDFDTYCQTLYPLTEINSVLLKFMHFLILKDLLNIYYHSHLTKMDPPFQNVKIKDFRIKNSILHDASKKRFFQCLKRLSTWIIHKSGKPKSFTLESKKCFLSWENLICLKNVFL